MNKLKLLKPLFYTFEQWDRLHCIEHQFDCFECDIAYIWDIMRCIGSRKDVPLLIFILIEMLISTSPAVIF